MKFKTQNSPLPVALVLATCSQMSLAEKNKIEEVIVEGEKISRSLQDTASSVGVYMDAQIENAAIYDLHDVLDRMANVNGAAGNEGFTIRGINNQAVASSIGASGLASLYIDGAFISSSGIRAGQKELWDVKQVEVFRGPQSTNIGRSALAGSIFIRTNDPSYEPEGRYRIAYGTDNTQVISVAYGNTIIDEQLAFRIAIDDQQTDGYVNNEILNDDQADSSNRTIRGKLLFEPASIEGLSILTTISHAENESGDGFVSLIDENGNDISPFEHKAFANVQGFENFDQSIAVIETSYSLDDIWTLTNTLSWNDGERNRQDDSDRQASGGEALRSRNNNIETISNELRLNYVSEDIQGNIGLYYFDQDREESINDLIDNNLRSTIIAIINSDPDFAALVPFAGTIAGFYDDPFFFNRVGFRNAFVENWAVFANIDYQMNDFVELFGGIRYDREEVRNVAREVRGVTSTLPDPSVLPFPLDSAVTAVNGLVLSTLNLEELDNNADFSAFLPKAGITLNWSDDLSTSFSVQRSYRAGGAATSGFGNFEFDPEFATNYDFALRSQWFDQRLTVNANLFYIDWKDQQIQVVEPIAAVEFLTINAGKSEVKGAELEISGYPNDVLDVYFNIGYVRTEFIELPDEVTLPGGVTLEGGNFKGNEFNDAPRLTVSTGISYDIQDDLTWQLDVNYQRESYSNAENSLKNDSRTVFNSKLKYRLDDNIELALVVRNLFDKEYIVFNDVARDQVVNIGQPRTLLLQVQGSF